MAPPTPEAMGPPAEHAAALPVEPSSPDSLHLGSGVARTAPSPLARNFAVVVGSTGLSRIVGFAREAGAAALFGAQPIGEALTLAFQVPNFLRRLLGEGALTAAFLPMFAKADEGADRSAARRLVAVVGGAQIAVLAAIAVVGTLACLVLPPSALATWVEPDRASLVLRYLAILAPYVLPVCLYAFAMAILNARARFLLPALAPVVQNLISLGALGLAWGIAGGFGDPRRMTPEQLDLGARIVSFGLLGGGCAMCLWCLPALRAEGMFVRPRIELAAPEFRAFVAKLAPALLAMGVVQVSVLLSSCIAFVAVGNGANVHLNCAARLFQLPQGMIGAAVATAAFPHLARSWAGGRIAEVRTELDRGLALATFLGAPAAAGLLALALPIVTLLFGHGRFTPRDCEETARAVVAFAISIPILTVVPLLVRVFYAAGDTRTPSWIAAGLVVGDVGLAYLLGRRFGAAGIATATTVTAIANFTLLVALARRFGVPRSAMLAKRVAKIVLLSLACGLAAAAVRMTFEAIGGAAPDRGRASVLAEVVAGVGAGLAVYLVGAAALRVPELAEFRALFTRRRR